MTPVATGGGKVHPLGIGYVHLRLLRSDGSASHKVLEGVLYIPRFPLNIFSAYLHDLEDGYDRQRVLYNSDGSEVCQLLRGNNCLHLRLDTPPYVLNQSDPGLNFSAFFLTPFPDADIAFPAAIHEAPVTLELLHRRLGHISFENVKKTIKESLGLSFSHRATDIALDVTRLCDSCEMCKPRKTVRRHPRERELEYGDRLYTDVFFINPPGYNHHTAGMIFTDGKTGDRFGFTLLKRNMPTIAWSPSPVSLIPSTISILSAIVLMARNMGVKR